MKKKYILPQAEVIMLESKLSLMALSDPTPPVIDGSREDDVWVLFEFNSDDIKQFDE